MVVPVPALHWLAIVSFLTIDGIKKSPHLKSVLLGICGTTTARRRKASLVIVAALGLCVMIVYWLGIRKIFEVRQAGRVTPNQPELKMLAVVAPSQPEGSSTPREKAIDGRDVKRTGELKSVHRKGEKINLPARATLEIGLTLGADKGIGTDAVVDCRKPSYVCLDESDIKKDHGRITFDIGQKGWGRLIFRIKNSGEAKLVHPMSHIFSSSPVLITYAPAPDPSHKPPNVLEITGGNDIYPFSKSQANVDTPIDIVVPPGLNSFDLTYRIFGDNMKAYDLRLICEVSR